MVSSGADCLIIWVCVSLSLTWGWGLAFLLGAVICDGYGQMLAYSVPTSYSAGQR
jgi:hypothetical protein